MTSSGIQRLQCCHTINSTSKSGQQYFVDPWPYNSGGVIINILRYWTDVSPLILVTISTFLLQRVFSAYLHSYLEERACDNYVWVWYHITIWLVISCICNPVSIPWTCMNVYFDRVSHILYKLLWKLTKHVDVMLVRAYILMSTIALCINKAQRDKQWIACQVNLQWF